MKKTMMNKAGELCETDEKTTSLLEVLKSNSEKIKTKLTDHKKLRGLQDFKVHSTLMILRPAGKTLREKLLSLGDDCKEASSLAWKLLI